MSPEEESQLLALLRKLKPGYYPKEIFFEFLRLNTIVSVEVVTYLEGGDDRVVLTKRPDDDPFWKGLYHVPGCIVRSTDTLDDACNRVINEELGSPEVVGDMEFLGTKYFRSQRRNGISLVYKINIKEPIIGKSFSINELPDDRIKGQDEFIFWNSKQALSTSL